MHYKKYILYYYTYFFLKVNKNKCLPHSRVNKFLGESYLKSSFLFVFQINNKNLIYFVLFLSWFASAIFWHVLNLNAK